MEKSYIRTMSNFSILVKTLLIFPIPSALTAFPKRGVSALTAILRLLLTKHLLDPTFSWESIYSNYRQKIELAQRRAVRFATNRYHNTCSVTDMFQDLDWESLESRREKIQLTLLFKVIQDLVDILTPASTRIRANHTKKLRQISSRSDSYNFSFFPGVWNSLPATVAESPDLVSFKQGLSTLTF